MQTWADHLLESEPAKVIALRAVGAGQVPVSNVIALAGEDT
jgi:hypothetical protein